MDLSRVELPDGRVLEFRGENVVGFNLTEAQRHARRGARARRLALTDLYRRDDDGVWRIARTGYIRSYEAVQSLDDVPSWKLTANRWATETQPA